MKILIKNYYYLTAGILGILFAFTHAWNGKTNVFPFLSVDKISIDMKTALFYVWHIITAENLLFGLAFIFMSFHNDLSKVRFTAWIIVILMIFRWIVILGATSWFNISKLQGSLVDSVAIVIYVSLIVFGIRVKDSQIR